MALKQTDAAEQRCFSSAATDDAVGGYNRQQAGAHMRENGANQTQLSHVSSLTELQCQYFRILRCRLTGVSALQEKKYTILLTRPARHPVNLEVPDGRQH